MYCDIWILGSGGDIEVIVTSIKDNKLLPVRQAFQQVFGRATVIGRVSFCIFFYYIFYCIYL